MAEESPLEKARAAATKAGLTGDDYDDFVEAKMRRAGYKRGPGEWVSVDDSEYEGKDDDDEPMTRGEYRRMMHERNRQKAKQMSAPPKKDPQDEDDNTKTKQDKKPANSWWKDYE